MLTGNNVLSHPHENIAGKNKIDMTSNFLGGSSGMAPSADVRAT